MDITNLIKKSYRSYGSFFSDDFLAVMRKFLGENNVSRKIFFSFLSIFVNVVKFFFLAHRFRVHLNRNSRCTHLNLLLEKKSSDSK
jgi:hypothetical protein